MVMNKTEVKKLMVKTAIEVLINKFNAEVEDSGDGRFDVQIDKFQGQLDRRDLEVGFWDSAKLAGSGWSAEERQHQQDSVELENKINAEIKRVLAELEL
jgi:hypothetical protein